jgi:hypothetical protein
VTVKEFAYLLVSFKQDDSSAFITSCKIVSGVVKLDGGDNIGYADR